MIKFIICQGIGFSPGSVKYIPTLGFVSDTAVVTWVTTGAFALRTKVAYSG